MPIRLLSTREWIDMLDKIEQDKMDERQDFDSYIHVSAKEGFTQCGRDTDTLTYILTWNEYIQAASGEVAYPYQGKVPYCGTCNNGRLF